MIDYYDWPGGREAMIRLGPDDGPVVIVALPLFEEANRTRTFAVTMLRALADRGIAGVLPDFPGTGESEVALEDVTLLRMREAHEALVLHFDALGRQTYAAGIRSGALLDTFSLMFGRWHFAPQAGEDLLRELVRLKNVETGARHRYDVHTIVGADEDPTSIAGNRVASAMLADILCASPYEDKEVARRVVRMVTDPKPADVKVPGRPLWRSAEPDNDLALARMLAGDIADWVRTCAA